MPVLLGAVISALPASSALAGGTADLRPFIVCPEALPGCCGPPTAQAATQTCCPEPTDQAAASQACCPEPITAGTSCCVASSCTQSLSLAITPNPVTEGHKATISGTLTGGTVAAQTVVLWQRLAGQSAFSNVAHAETNATGAYQFLRAVKTNAEWYAQVGSVESSTVAEPVLARIVLRRSRSRPAAGKKFKLSASISPGHAGDRVTLQLLRGRRWVTIARPKLGGHSSFALTRRAPAHSVERFRVVLAADARNARSVSSVVVVTVA